MLINISNVPLEYARDEHVKVFEEVTKLVNNDGELAGSIAANLLVDVIFTNVMHRDIEQMDRLIDALAVGLKAACRDCLAADLQAGHA